MWQSSPHLLSVLAGYGPHLALRCITYSSESNEKGTSEPSNIHCYNQNCSCVGDICIWAFSYICTLLFIRRGRSAMQLGNLGKSCSSEEQLSSSDLLRSGSAKHFLWTTWYYGERKGWLQRAHSQLSLEFRIWEDRDGKMMQDLSYLSKILSSPFCLHRTASHTLSSEPCPHWAEASQMMALHSLAQWDYSLEVQSNLFLAGSCYSW